MINYGREKLDFHGWSENRAAQGEESRLVVELILRAGLLVYSFLLQGHLLTCFLSWSEPVGFHSHRAQRSCLG